MARTAKKEKTLTPEEKLAQALVPDMEQPYRLPENWCWVWHNSILDISGGSQPDKSLFIPEPKAGYTQLYQTRDYGEHPIPVFIPDKYATKTTVEGDILLARYGGSLGKVFKARAGAYNVALAKVITLRKGAINNELLFYYYLSHFYQDFCVKAAYGRSAQAGFNRDDLAGLMFPLPPLAEQKRIVDRIESLFAKLDEAKEKAQAVVDGFEDRKAAILHKAFTGELTEEWRRNNGISRDTWNNCTIGDIFIHTTGKALKKSNANGSLHKYITTSNLYWGRFDFSEVREMYFTDDELNKCTAKKGDLLICNGGDVGRAAIWNYDYDICIQNHISKLRKKQNNIDVVFCYYFFMLSKIKGKINSKGIGIASLSAKDLLSMRIDVPSIEEQHEISSILDELFNNEQQAKEAAEQVIVQIDTMKKSILARAFRGELGTNKPTDESAVELLKRVLCDDVPAPQRAKPVTIPKGLSKSLRNDLEKKIIKLYFQRDAAILSVKEIMSVSSKTFEVLDCLRSLQNRQIIIKQEDGNYRLMG